MSDLDVMIGKQKAEHNAMIERTNALELKMFELVKQEFPDDYSATEVSRAIKLLAKRLFG